MQRDVLDARAWEGLFATHAPEVFGYAARRLGAGPAADVTVSVFASSWLDRAELGHGGDRPIVWFMRAARAAMAPHARVEQRRQQRVDAELVDRFAGGGPPLEVSVDDLLRWLRIAALLALDPDDREVVTLLGWTSLSRQEVPRVVGRPDHEVEASLARAHQVLASADDHRVEEHGLSASVDEWLVHLWEAESALTRDRDRCIQARLGAVLRFERDVHGAHPFVAAMGPQPGSP